MSVSQNAFCIALCIESIIVLPIINFVNFLTFVFYIFFHKVNVLYAYFVSIYIFL